MSRHVFRSAALLTAISLLLAGCAFTYSIKPELLPAAEASAMVQQWPLTVGLYVTPKVRSREFSRGAAHVPAGNELASSFQWAVSQLFANVVVLDAAPTAGSIPNGVAGIVELSDVALHEGDKPITYEINFYSGLGLKSETWSLVGTIPLWDGERSSLSATMQNVGTGLSYGIRNQTANFMLELPKQDVVKQWFEKAGVRETQLRPFHVQRLSKIQTAEKVMMLPDLLTWRYTDNNSAMECVGNRLRSYHPPVGVVAMDDVIRLEFFPWLEPSTGPKTTDDFRSWFSHPAIQDKMRDLGIRYLLSLQGGTKTEIPGGGILCGASMGGGGCLGFAWGTHESAFSASLFDLQDQAEPKELTSRESSGVYVPAFILPIPLLAPTESVACERLAHDLHETIVKMK